MISDVPVIRLKKTEGSPTLSIEDLTTAGGGIGRKLARVLSETQERIFTSEAALMEAGPPVSIGRSPSRYLGHVTLDTNILFDVSRGLPIENTAAIARLSESTIITALLQHPWLLPESRSISTVLREISARIGYNYVLPEGEASIKLNVSDPRISKAITRYCRILSKYCALNEIPIMVKSYAAGSSGIEVVMRYGIYVIVRKWDASPKIVDVVAGNVRSTADASVEELTGLVKESNSLFDSSVTTAADSPLRFLGSKACGANIMLGRDSPSVGVSMAANVALEHREAPAASMLFVDPVAIMECVPDAIRILSTLFRRIEVESFYRVLPVSK